jgi:hypothetical protein
MKRKLFILVLAISVMAGCFHQGSFNYKQSMISSGDNYPDFDLTKGRMDRLLVALHLGRHKDAIIKEFNWDSKTYESTIAFLEQKGFVRNEKGRYLPTCMVISAEDGKSLLRDAEPIARQVSDSILSILPGLRNKYSTSSLAKTIPSDSIAFFLLSDVILDNWQIGNVENIFIHAERPLRHGKRYYYSFMEQGQDSTGPFGIYGNMYFDGFVVYGNNQNKVDQYKIRSKVASLPRLDSTDYRMLDECSSLFTGKLISILQSRQEYINEVYEKSGYSKEVSYPEFFIWWYHFIYTRATDILAEQAYLEIPAGGNFYYRVN